MERLIRTKRGRPCPICGQGNEQCSFNSIVALCVNVPSDRECQGDRQFKTTWIHRLKEDRPKGYVPYIEKPGCALASREILDQVYRAFLGMLKLEPRHWKNLIQSKVPGKVIVRGMYRSVPEAKERWLYAKMLLKKGFSLKGIPGFFQAESARGTYWTFTAREGYFIPVVDKDGFIIRLRVRLDKPETDAQGRPKRKYRWFSSGSLLYGTASPAVCHVALGNLEEVYVTEGERKADVVRELTGKTCVSVPGVGTWRLALEIVKALNPKKVIVAYDMDKETNPDVLSSEGYLIEALKELPEVVVQKASWDISLGKGIDDFLLATGQEPEVLAA